MKRKDLLIVALLAFGIALPATANQAYFDSYKRQLAEEIDMLDWNLRHSSVAPTLAPERQRQSLALIGQARAALAAGKVGAAEDFAAEAALPLTTVVRRGPIDAHPDRLRYFREIRQALLSITDSAERIARDKGTPRDYRSETLVAVATAEHALKEGDIASAFAIVGARYESVSRSAASYRSGETFHVAAPEWRDGRHFQDGIRRIDDRRFLTEHLIVEAQMEGIDDTPLREALAIAKASRVQAAAYAERENWPGAFASLELAFAEIEDRWKQVGLEW